MTATVTRTTQPVGAVPGRGTQLRRAVAAEWTRIWTVRSTWWSLAGALGLLLVFATGYGLDTDGRAPVWVPGEIGIMFAQLPLAIPALLAVTSEYSTGAIRSSLLAVPRRGVLATARAAVGVCVAVGCAVLFAATASTVSWALLGSRADVSAGSWAASLVTIAAVVAAVTLITIGVGTSLRSSAGSLTVVVLVQAMLPELLPEFGVPWLTAVAEHLPGYPTIALLDPYGDPTVSVGRATAILMAWALAALAAGAWSMMRRDAD